MTYLPYLLTALAFLAAGVVNTVAGGGSFLTFPALLMAGLDPRAANITSTMALFPMQINAGYLGRKHISGIHGLSVTHLVFISLCGGTVGAILLLLTPIDFFARLVPWLVLFATAVFTYGSFHKKNDNPDYIHPISRKKLIISQLVIATYGGYFGAGIGILMLSALTLAGMKLKIASMTKNVLAAAINTSAFIIFTLSHDVDWSLAVLGAVSSIGGSFIGMRILHKVSDKVLRVVVIGIGITLSIALFMRQ